VTTFAPNGTTPCQCAELWAQSSTFSWFILGEVVRSDDFDARADSKSCCLEIKRHRRESSYIVTNMISAIRSYELKKTNDGAPTMHLVASKEFSTNNMWLAA
jgi:hypothetical protein